MSEPTKFERIQQLPRYTLNSFSVAVWCGPRLLVLSISCEGGVDVVGVVTLFVRGGAQVVLHGDQVVDLSVLLGMHEKEELEGR